MSDHIIHQALARLENVTPMKYDCGRLCAAACCQGSDQDGMLLFPGEICRIPDAHVQPTQLIGFSLPAFLVVCQGHCDRKTRPLACRLFPLMAKENTGGEVTVKMDARGRAVCPLCRQPLASLNPEFVTRVQAIYAMLMQDPQQAAFLRALMALEQEYQWDF